MLKFIHLTDTHLVVPGRSLYGSDPARRLRQAVESINREHVDASFAIVTGDLAHWGEAEAYVELREVLAALAMPVHLLIGNHDDRTNFLQAFPGTSADSNGFVQYAFTAGGIRHIALDSNEPGVSWGVFCEKRAQWLKQALSSSDGLPVHLFIHHPPFPVGIPSMDRISLRDATALRKAIEAHRSRIRHLFFGHIHRPMGGSWMSIPTTTVRATNHQVALDLVESERVPGSMEPPQYAIVFADETSTIVHFHDFSDRSDRFPL
jgi:3',5'-cyclic-AMP phosphodiesterase